MTEARDEMARLTADVVLLARDGDGSLTHAAQGSANPTIQEAMGLYAQITDTAEQLLGLVSAACRHLRRIAVGGRHD